MASSNILLRFFKRNLLKSSMFNNQNAFSSRRSQLVEIGHLETPKLVGKYEAGQLFIHKVFGYRGIILFPWLARIFDKDWEFRCPCETGFEPVYVGGREVMCSTQHYYQVFIDSRDQPHVKAQAEAVTVLGNFNNFYRSFSVPGLDYVAHGEILPYTSTEKQPIKHEMFDKFFLPPMGKSPCLEAKEILKVWQASNFPWLKVSDVYKERTEEIRATVIPFYKGCHRTVDTTTIHSWRYCIRLENVGDKAVKLRDHRWKIISMTGLVETAKGNWITGQEPVLDKSSPAFQCSGHISLVACYGHMCGSFKAEREDGSSFECRVPLFVLESRMEDETPF